MFIQQYDKQKIIMKQHVPWNCIKGGRFSSKYHSKWRACRFNDINNKQKTKTRIHIENEDSDCIYNFDRRYRSFFRKRYQQNFQF